MKQIYPATITGKSFAPGGSVLDHAFGQSEPFTLGVEEEYMLLDGQSFDLVQHIDTVLAAISGHELETHINPELMQSVLEIATPVCRTAGDIDLEPASASPGSRARMTSASIGTHPLQPSCQRIIARELQASDRPMQYVPGASRSFPIHAPYDPEKAIQVVTHLLAHIPSFLLCRRHLCSGVARRIGLASSRQTVSPPSALRRRPSHAWISF
jgi:carboxylate-amine ligase